MEQNAKHSASQYRHILVSDEGVSRNSWNIHKVLDRHEDLAEAVADRFGIGHDVDVGTVKSRALKCINDVVENGGGADDTGHLPHHSPVDDDFISFALHIEQP
jgi:hypothetical protein